MTWSHPYFFFLRRTAFAIVSVLLMDWPSAQMAIHQVLTLVALLHLISQAFEERVTLAMELASELLMLATSALIQQCMRTELASEQLKAVNTGIKASIYTLVAFNLCFLLFIVGSNCKERCRRRYLLKKRTQMMQARAE